MASIIDIYKKSTPSNGKVNTKGGDVEPIGDANAFKPSRDLSKDEKALAKARGGALNTKKYSDSMIK
jgi:hypothetical protein